MAERDGDKIENEKIEQAPLAVLPAVESPPLSPAGASSDEPAEAEASVETADAIEAAGDENSGTAEPAKEDGAAVSALTASRRWLKLSRRQQHRLTLTAWVMLVAGLGALFGGAVSNGLAVRDRTEVASLAQSRAMQQSIDRLTKQVGELKTKLAAATAHSRIAKNTAFAPNADITGSITGSIPSSSSAHLASVPLPRPEPPRIAAAVSRPAVVHDWRILRTRGGLVDVIGRDGIFEVVPGAVLPGLGPVRSIEQRNGRWMVVTPKGIIVSARDRGYFADF
jgi:hypothetical protein